MATIKSYTDIEQSRKLAEFLPLDSADMFYDGVQDLYKEKVYNIPTDGSSITVRTGHVITDKGIKANLLLPCWSLAALLESMPKKIKYNGGIVYPEFHIWNNSFEYNNNADYVLHITNSYDNPIDACVEMIIKLHELNLL